MQDHIQKIADFVAPSAWVTWITIHTMQVHSVLQDIALVTSVFATVAAGLFHFTKWWRMVFNDKQSED